MFLKRSLYLTLLTVLIMNNDVNAQQNPESSIAATYKNKSITVEQIDKEIDQKPDFAQYKQQNPQDLPKLRYHVVNSIISRELLIDEAKKSGGIDEAAVQKQLQEILKQGGGEDQIRTRLASVNASYETFLASVSDDIRLNLYVVKNFVDKITVSNAEIEQEFAKANAASSTSEQVKASHILIRATAGNPEEDASAKKKIDNIYLEVLTPGSDFAELSKKYSEDPGSASKGGDLGFFRKGQMVKEFDEAVFSMKPGQISRPIKTQFGYHIIKVTDTKKGQALSLPEVRPAIEQHLKSLKVDKLVQAKVEQLKKSAGVKIFLPAPQPIATP